MQYIRLAYLLRHAPAYGYYHVAPRSFKLFKHADVAVSMVFGVFPYATGIKNNDVGILHAVARGIAEFRKHARDALGIVNVHLAAVCYYVVMLFKVFHYTNNYIILRQFFQINLQQFIYFIDTILDEKVI